MDRKPQWPWYSSHGVSVPGARLFPQYHRTGKNLCSSAAQVLWNVQFRRSASLTSVKSALSKSLELKVFWNQQLQKT